MPLHLHLYGLLTGGTEVNDFLEFPSHKSKTTQDRALSHSVEERLQPKGQLMKSITVYPNTLLEGPELSHDGQDHTLTRLRSSCPPLKPKSLSAPESRLGRC